MVVTVGLVAFHPVHAQIKVLARELPGAEDLFRTESRWAGCQRAVSFRLLDGRILWMFSESVIHQAASDGSEKPLLLHNSVALQIGSNPATAELVHFWDMSTRRPQSYFKDARDYWFWPVDGIEIGSSLLLLLFKVRSGSITGKPEIVEWSVLRILNHQDSPSRWKIQKLPTPANQFGAVFGFGGLVQIGGYIITWARLPDEGEDLFLVRWPLDRIVRFDFTTPQWWTADEGWVAQEAISTIPTPTVTDLEGELCLTWNSATDGALIVASLKDQPDVLVSLQAPSPSGPWSEPEEVLQLDTGDTFEKLTLSFCRGLLPGQTILSVVQVAAPGRPSFLPQLYTISSR